MAPDRPEAHDDEPSVDHDDPISRLELPETGTGARARLRQAREAAAGHADPGDTEPETPYEREADGEAGGLPGPDRSPETGLDPEPAPAPDPEPEPEPDLPSSSEFRLEPDGGWGYGSDLEPDMDPDPGVGEGADPGAEFDFEPLGLFGSEVLDDLEDDRDDSVSEFDFGLDELHEEAPAQQESLELDFDLDLDSESQDTGSEGVGAELDPAVDVGVTWEAVPDDGDPEPAAQESSAESDAKAEPAAIDEEAVAGATVGGATVGEDTVAGDTADDTVGEDTVGEGTAVEATPARRRRRLFGRERGPKIVSPPPRRARWRRVAFGSTLVLLFVTGLALIYVGVRAVSESTEGKIVDVTDDPNAPGFEALVTPSPTMLLIHHREDEVLGYTFLVLGPDDRGGAVVFIPTGTIAELPNFGDQPVSLAYAGGGSPVAVQVIQNLLGTGILESVEIEDPRWTTLTEPVAPFAIDNPDEVVITDPETGAPGLLFPKGEIEVEAVGVGQYLGVDADGLTELGRLVRNEIFWRAWLDAIAAADPSTAVPGESDSGLGRFVRGLAAGPVEILTLPVDDIEPDPEDNGEGAEDLFEPRTTEIEALITQLVPLPTSPEPGVRPKIRLLNGTPDRDLLGSLVQPLVDSGAEISVFGNAPTFSEPTTQIIYTDSRFSDDVRDLQTALGVGEIVRAERPVENIDITIVVGSDYTGEDR